MDSETRQLQEWVNSGTAWRLEGAVGRAAMALLEVGDIMLPQQAHTDYWGNTVPNRDWLEPGSKGTRELVVSVHGEEYAEELDAIEREDEGQ